MSLNACQNCEHTEEAHSPLAGCTGKTDAGWCPCDAYVRPPTPTHEVDEHGKRVPVTPYDGGTSSGSSGTETSAARAQRDDANGTTKARHQATLNLVASKGTRGVTVKDLREMTGWHHGVASGALSNLHAGGLLARLTFVRDRCKVYVLPANVNDRETEPHGVRTSKAAGRVKRRPITLTVAEADALTRLTTAAAAAEKSADDRVLVRLRPTDLRLVVDALTARDDQPARRGA